MPHLSSTRMGTPKVSVTEPPVGYDNQAYENNRYRRFSTNSNTYQEDRLRKKSILHDSHNHRNSLDVLENGEPRTKKVSVAESEHPTRSLDTVLEGTEEEGRSWWYNFCLKCSSKDVDKPSWEPKFWQRVFPHPYCPTYRQFSRIAALILIGAFSWCILYSIVGETAAPPDGILFQLIVLSTCAYFGGWLMTLVAFPPLVGMLFTGILLQNINAVDIDEHFTEITKEVGHIALVIILIRAGLDLDPIALKKLKYTVLKLSLIPWCVEAGAVMILSRYFLDISWSYAALLGSIIAAVSPAVIVPCLFRLRAKGYGVAKGIPTLIIAVASIDDAASVAIFGIIKSIIFSDSSAVSNSIFGPLSIVAGIGFGILWGILCNFLPERNDPFMTPLRILLVLTGGMGAVFGSELLGYEGAGPLGCVTAAFAAMACWSRHGWEVDDNPAATAFEILWMIIQPVLFGVTGTKIKFNELDGSVVGISVGILVAAAVTRIVFTVLIGFGCRLNLKEKIFVSIAWMCKAIVQAALGPIALTLLDPGTVEYEYAEKILTTCVLSIIVTAPTGALLTTFLGPQLLTKANLPPLAEVRKRKKSRLSLRDLSIADESEFLSNLNGTTDKAKIGGISKDGVTV